MKKSFILLISTIYFGFFSFSCFAKGEPQWIKDINSVYPKNVYFSAIGYGKDSESAKYNAFGTLTQNLQSSVQVVTNSALVEQQDEKGNVSRSSSIEKSVQIVSSLSLSGVEYSETYFDKKKKLYFVAAYLENQILFEQISVKAERPLKQMNSCLERAETMEKENDPLNSYFILKDGEKYCDEFLSWYYIMYTADKKQAFSIYKNNIANAYDFPLIMKDYLSKCLITINANSDFDKLSKDKLISKLKSSGFTIAGEGSPVSKAIYTADVIVNLNIKTDGEKDDILYLANPTISINLLGKNTIIYTWQGESQDKILSYDKANITKKCSASIVKLLENFPIF